MPVGIDNDSFLVDRVDRRVGETLQFCKLDYEIENLDLEFVGAFPAVNSG